VPVLTEPNFAEANPLIMRDVKVSEKANHYLHNLFHESVLQKRLSSNLGSEKVSAPLTH
jgi:hypothetical protein